MNIIVAAGADGAIGLRGSLIWRIPADLKRFKSLTMGHPVVMGRKTWESLPKKPLPGRRNIVLTHRPGYEALGADTASSPEEAVAMCGGEEAFIIGGERVYSAFLPFADRIFLTDVDAVCPEADAWFRYDSDEWMETDASEWMETEGGVRFRYRELSRR